MTSRAKETGFLTVVTPETAPHLLPHPSMMLASISTVPFAVRADPRPELNRGSVSSSLTCIAQTKSQNHVKVVFVGNKLQHIAPFGIPSCGQDTQAMQTN